jgi:integrase
MNTSKKPSTTPRTRLGSGLLQLLTQEELKRLFAVIKDKRDKALFLLAYRHGLRASEIGLLQRTDVDLKQGRITIHRLKGSLSGIYPLQPDVIKLLRSYLRARTDASPYLFLSNRGVPIDRRTLWCAMQTYGEKAELPPEKRKFHNLKHSIGHCQSRAQARRLHPERLRPAYPGSSRSKERPCPTWSQGRSHRHRAAGILCPRGRLWPIRHRI